MSWKNAEAASEFMKRVANPNRRLIVRALALASKGAGATFGLSVAFTKSLEVVPSAAFSRSHQRFSSPFGG
jgi:hypothetical protein